MKKLICVLTLMLALMLALPVTARAEAAQSVSTQAPEADADENVWTIYDEDGQYLTSIYGRVYLDDEYISSDNRLYRIIEVDDSKRTAVAQYIGQESLLEPDNEAVATVAIDRHIFDAFGRIVHSHRRRRVQGEGCGHIRCG